MINNELDEKTNSKKGSNRIIDKTYNSMIYNIFFNIRKKLKIKDVFFRELFGNDKEALLELYNALNNTTYTDVNELEVMTIENAIYINYKNDVAFMITGVINLYEHQSTVNPNMPVRFLIYLGQEYQKIITAKHKSMYGNALIQLPTPKCIVFYNGDKEIPEELELKLSDAYENKEITPDVELVVKVLNVNFGHNEDLMNKCKILSEYAEFMNILKKNRKIYKLERAISETIDYCIENNILSEFLRKHRANVHGSLLTDFDRRKYVRTIREEGKKEGQEELILLQYRDGVVSAEKAAQYLGITVEEFMGKI